MNLPSLLPSGGAVWRMRLLSAGFCVSFCVSFFVLLCVLLCASEASSAPSRSGKATAHHLMNEMSEDVEETDGETDSERNLNADSRSSRKKTGKASASNRSASTARSETSSKSGKSGNSGKSGSPSKSGNSGKSGSSSRSGKSGSRTSDSKKSGASSSRSDSSSRKKPVTAKKTKNARGKKPEPEPEDLRTPEEKEQDRLAYFRETGIWRWPELTEAQLTKAVESQKTFLEEVKAKFPKTLYYESEHFFYLTDAPEPLARECLKYLEAMFARLCDVFEFPKGASVWNGKCIVCAFIFQQQFLQFEQEFFGQTANQFAGASGLAHMTSEGNVLISLFYGDTSSMEARWKFIGILVHESTHGFLHRYRARQEVPLWLNEGIADLMPRIIVPADRQPLLKQRSALERMRQTGSVGGLLMTDGPIEAWQYGVASGLVEFLIKQNSHAFKQFLDDLKDGKEWNAALKEHYQCSSEELLFHFGRANRIPKLTF